MLRDVSVREVMNGDYVGISESDGLVESVDLLLSEGAQVGLVLRGDDVVGALTPTGALAAFVGDETVEDLEVGTTMATDVPTIRPDHGLHEARDRMRSASSTWLAVTDGDRPLGVVTEHDLLAGSTMGAEPAPEGQREAESTVMTPVATATSAETESADEDAFEDQGICEVCGALSADLATFNGQLRCADCRDV